MRVTVTVSLANGDVMRTSHLLKPTIADVDTMMAKVMGILLEAIARSFPWMRK